MPATAGYTKVDLASQSAGAAPPQRRGRLIQGGAVAVAVVCAPLFIWPATLPAIPVMLALGALHLGLMSVWVLLAIQASTWGVAVLLAARRLTARAWLPVVLGLIAAAWLVVPWALLSAGD